MQATKALDCSHSIGHNSTEPQMQEILPTKLILKRVESWHFSTYWDYGLAAADFFAQACTSLKTTAAPAARATARSIARAAGSAVLDIKHERHVIQDLVKEGNYRAAFHKADEARKRFSDSFALRIAYADLAAEVGCYSISIQEYRAITISNASDSEKLSAYEGIALSNAWLGNGQAALEAAREAVAINQQSRRAAAAAGLVLGSHDIEPDAAEGEAYAAYCGASHHLAVSASAETDPFILTAAGHILAGRGDFDLAAAKFARALELRPQFPLARALQAGNKAQMGDLAGAQAELAAVIRDFDAGNPHACALAATLPPPSGTNRDALLARALYEPNFVLGHSTRIAVAMQTALESGDNTTEDTRLQASLKALERVEGAGGAVKKPVHAVARARLYIAQQRWVEADVALQLALVHGVNPSVIAYEMLLTQWCLAETDEEVGAVAEKITNANLHSANAAGSLSRASAALLGLQACVLMDLEHYGAARVHYEALVRRGSTLQETYLGLGMACIYDARTKTDANRMTAQMARGSELLRTYLDSSETVGDSRRGDAWIALAVAAVEQGSFQEAQSCLNRAKCYGRCQYLAEALRNQAEDALKQNSATGKTLTEIKAVEGREGLQLAYDHARQNNFTDADSVQWLAQRLRGVGAVREALRYFQVAKMLVPTDSPQFIDISKGIKEAQEELSIRKKIAAASLKAAKYVVCTAVPAAVGSIDIHNLVGRGLVGGMQIALGMSKVLHTNMPKPWQDYWEKVWIAGGLTPPPVFREQSSPLPRLAHPNTAATTSSSGAPTQSIQESL